MRSLKFKSGLFLIAILFLLSGCLVYSFYPIYTKEDLFANDLLLGKWIDDDSTIWNFEYQEKQRWSMKKEIKVDSTAYILKIKDKNETNFSESSLIVRIIELENNYFLDFFLKDHNEHEGDFFDLHLIPVHSFAKIELENSQAKIRWFNPEWLADLIKRNKIRIHHEMDDDRILLTAKPKELQKFVTKYVNSEEAFDEGFDVCLTKIH